MRWSGGVKRCSFFGVPYGVALCAGTPDECPRVTFFWSPTSCACFLRRLGVCQGALVASPVGYKLGHQNCFFLPYKRVVIKSGWDNSFSPINR